MEVAASIRSSLPSGKGGIRAPTAASGILLLCHRPSSRCPLPPTSVPHLDLEHGDSCTQRPWHLARYQQALCRASPPLSCRAIRALCASGSKGTPRCTPVSAPPRALSVASTAAERNTCSTTCSSTPGRGLSSARVQPQLHAPGAIGQDQQKHTSKAEKHTRCSPSLLGHRPSQTKKRAVWGSLGKACM